MTYIPPEINNLQSLETLILNYNKLTKIENINNLLNLTRLEMRSNKITILKNFENLSKLKFITFSCNLLKSIEIFPYLENLEELGLFGNFLGDELNLERNKQIFDYLIDEIGAKCPKIKILYIGGNHFIKLDESLTMPKIKSSLKNLIKLDSKHLN